MTRHSFGLGKLLPIAAVLLALLCCVPFASAQEDEKPQQITFDTDSQEKCVTTAQQQAAVLHMVKNNEIDYDENAWKEEGVPGLAQWAAIHAEELANRNPERTLELAEHYADKDSVGTWMGGMVDNVNCFGIRTAKSVTDPIVNGVSKLWESPLGKLSEGIMEGSQEALATTMTMWTDYKVKPQELNRAVDGVRNIVYAIVGLALISAMVVGGVRLAISRRQGISDGLDDIGKTVGLYLVFALVIPPMLAGAMVASDELADWILDSFGGTAEGVALGGALNDQSIGGPFLMLAIHLLAFFGALMQMVALAVRMLLIPVAGGLVMLFAALSYSSIGKNGMNHLLSLIIASIAYKPIAALLYAVTFWLTGAEPEGAVDGFIKAFMIAAAGFMAPALVFALVPAVSQAGGSSGAAAMGAGMGALGASAAVGGGAASAVGTAAAKRATKAGGAAGTSGGNGAAGTGSVGPGGPSGGGGSGASGHANGGGPSPNPSGAGGSTDGAAGGNSPNTTGTAGGGAEGARGASGGNSPNTNAAGNGAQGQQRSQKAPGRHHQRLSNVANAGAKTAGGINKASRSFTNGAHNIDRILSGSVGSVPHYGGR